MGEIINMGAWVPFVNVAKFPRRRRGARNSASTGETLLSQIRCFLNVVNTPNS
jgi:hypothetical protein